MVSNPHHVGSREKPLADDPLAIDECPVGTEVRHHVALGRGDDLGVAARNLLVRNDDVADRLPAEDDRRPLDRILPTVRKAHQAPSRSRRGFRLLLSRPSGQLPELRNGLGAYELRAGAKTLIHKGEFPTPNLDFVTVKEGRWLGSELDAVDEDRCFLRSPSDRHLPVRGHHEDRMLRRQIGTVEHQKRRCVTSNHRLARRDLVTLTVEF